MTREEAIKNIKKVLPLSDTLAESFYTLIPELAESEDERIRKELISIINYLHDGVYYLLTTQKRDKYIAWLEEQKPADEQFPPLEGLDAIKAKYYDDGFKIGFDEGVESVKPAEWSEADEKHINNILDIIDYWKAITHFVSYQGSTIDADINWLKSLPLQPKQEWSEEDEETIKMAIETLEHENYLNLVERLKSLRPQPHWKPSEEQMEELDNARHNLTASCETLSSLYHDLKKLM